MKIEIDLTSEDILEKRFTINLKGYDVKEVDYFLDLIKKDYEMWKIMQDQKNDQIVKLTKECERLGHQVKIAKNHLILFKKELENLQDKGLNNIDIIQRLNKLEEKQ